MVLKQIHNGREIAKIDISEFENGKYVNEVSSFRKYSDVLDSMKDYLSFIKNNPRYKNAVDRAILQMNIFRKFKGWLCY